MSAADIDTNSARRALQSLHAVAAKLSERMAREAAVVELGRRLRIAEERSDVLQSV